MDLGFTKIYIHISNKTPPTKSSVETKKNCCPKNTILAASLSMFTPLI